MNFHESVIDPDKLQDIQPFWIYTTLSFGANKPSVYFTYTIDDGFTYLLETVSIKYETDGVVNNPQSIPKVELINSKRGRTDQNFPIPIDLITTPGEVSEIANVGAVKNRIHLNKVFINRETIEFKITRDLTEDPQEVQLLLCGYYLTTRGK